MDKISSSCRSANMRNIGSKNTAPEVLVRKIAHRLGFRFRLHDPKLPGKPDIIFPRLRKVIEVRGCFWHQHSACVDGRIPRSRTEYWREKLDRNVQRDADNLTKLQALGWDVLIVWECQVKDSTVLEDLLRSFLSR